MKKAELEEARARDRKHALTEIIEDRNPDRIYEEVTTQNATVGIEGMRLYNKLSDEIHRYRDTEYRVEEPGDWDIAISDILKALKPENFNEDGDVDWTEERKRYLSTESINNLSDNTAFSWNTAPMKKRITTLEDNKDQTKVDINQLKIKIRSLKKDLEKVSEKVKGETSDIDYGNTFS